MKFCTLFYGCETSNLTFWYTEEMLRYTERYQGKGKLQVMMSETLLELPKRENCNLVHMIRIIRIESLQRKLLEENIQGRSKGRHRVSAEDGPA